MRRTQISLTDGQHERLTKESESSGRSMAQIIRDRLDRADAEPSLAERSAALRDSFGAWKECDYDGSAYVEEIRSVGLAERLADLER